MYRLTLKNTALGRFNEETQRIDRYEAEQNFDCESLQQLTGLVEFMVATSDDVLDLKISRRDEKDD